MFNLITSILHTNNGFDFLFVELISILSLLFGLSVVNSKNPIVSVLFLIGLFVSISLNLIFIGHEFIGLSYLLVYVGAISILFLFILMLINIRVSELLNDTNNGIPLAIYTGFSFCFPIYLALISTDSLKEKSTDIRNVLYIFEDSKIEMPLSLDFLNESIISPQLNKLDGLDSVSVLNEVEINTNKSPMDFNSGLHLVYSNTWDNNLTNTLDITSIGNVLYSTYGIWLIISSVILLLAMIGAITITKKEKI